MVASSKPTTDTLNRRNRIAVFALWPLLWALIPAMLVWGIKPYLRQATFSVDGRSHAEIEAEINNQFAVEYLKLGGIVGMVSGLVAVRLKRTWQVLALSVASGVTLVAAFNIRNSPSFYPWESMARDAIQLGGVGGILFGMLFALAHRSLTVK